MIERTERMDAKQKDYNPLEWDAFLRPDWRSLDGRRLAHGEDAEWSSDDPDVVEFAAYIAAMADAHNDQQKQATVRDRWQAISAAHEIAQQDDVRRWQLEARILAGQTDAEIANRLGLAADTIAWYERLYFSVRDSLHAGDYVANQVIGTGIHAGFVDDEVGPFWMAIGYFGGPVVLESFIDSFVRVWQPGEPATLSIYLRPGIGIAPNIQGTVASSVLPPYGPAAETWIELRVQLTEASLAEDPDRRALLKERARDWLIRCGRAYLAGKPLPRLKRQPQRPKNRHAIDVRGTRAQGMSLKAGLVDVLGNTLGVDPRMVEAIANDSSVPSRQV
jgi:hypothetical protein